MRAAAAVVRLPVCRAMNLSSRRNPYPAMITQRPVHGESELVLNRVGADGHNQFLLPSRHDKEVESMVMPRFVDCVRPSRSFDRDDALQTVAVLAKLIHQVGSDSLTGLVLRSAQAEIVSLVRASDDEAANEPMARAA
jgi:hypothetical protein